MSKFLREKVRAASARVELVKEKKELKQLYKKKQKNWVEKKWRRVEWSKNMSDFWEAIRTFRPRKKTTGGKGINKEEWQAHFEILLGSDEQTGEGSRQSKRVEDDEKGEDDEVEGELKELNKEIQLSEMMKVMRYMEKRKAPGEDGIRLEFLNGLLPKPIIVCHSFLNDFWKQGKISERWEIARIYLIFKAGDKIYSTRAIRF